MSPIPFAAAVLVGGEASRMGTPKQHVSIDDAHTMGECMLACARKVAPLVIAAGPADAMDDIQCLPDSDVYKGKGPMAGLESILKSNLAAQWLVLPCDMPFLTIELLQAMRDHPGNDAVVLQHAGPLPMRLHIKHLAEIRHALDTGQHALRRLPFIEHAVHIDVDNPSCIRDIDCITDL
jgi:molybdopterin-guanine dinucleotide biosynthesis protein A